MRSAIRRAWTWVLCLGLPAAPAGAQVAAELDAFERRVAAAVEAVSPSVVTLAVRRVDEPASAPLHHLLRRRPEEWLAADLYHREDPTILVSGVVMTENGDILTSYAPVRGEVRSIGVRLPDGRRLRAERIGFDQRRDLALVRADLPRPAVPAFAADPPKVGQWVVAVGRVPDPARPTATVGIVSARQRMRRDGGFQAFQVDAEVNFGNVGGALVDLDGRLVGVACNLTENSQWGQNSGVGFAVYWDKIEDLLPRLQEGMKREVAPRPFIGVKSAEGALDVQGALIDEVIPWTPAADAGLEDGDLVTEVDGRPISRWEDLVKEIGNRKIGDWIRLTVDRGGETKPFRVRVGERAEE